MLNTNVYQRVLHIGYGSSIATCFTVDVDNKQYLVTAAHVVKGIAKKDNIQISSQGNWNKVPCELVGMAQEPVDIAVLALPEQITPSHSLPATSGNLILAQDMYFLGYPYGLFTDLGSMNSGFPMPFIKKCILSSVAMRPSSQIDKLYLDGINNVGFSGGPVVFARNLNQTDWCVAGVIHGYQIDHRPVMLGTQQTPLAVENNSGLVIAYGIRHAIELIENNPIGPNLTY